VSFVECSMGRMCVSDRNYDLASVESEFKTLVDVQERTSFREKSV
jgi:hypothetical protein